ncbi:MAG: hypothetical protein CMJ18_19525 [Phycisphaeraceae bacterium]|nr:hypothetical protein [Phycisphaeraceae bacterium]
MLMLITVANGEAPPELDQHTELIMKSGAAAGAAKAEGQLAVKAPAGRLVLVTIEFTDEEQAKGVGLDRSSLRRAAKQSLQSPKSSILRAREPVNLPVRHWWVQGTVALGGSDEDRRHYHVTLDLLHLSSSASTPKQNRYVLIERHLQKQIAVADRAGLQTAIGREIGTLARELAPRLEAPVEAANSSSRTPVGAQ